MRLVVTFTPQSSVKEVAKWQETTVRKSEQGWKFPPFLQELSGIHVGLFFTSLVANIIEQLFMCLLAICIVFFF
jgi:hypothetical protein